MKVVILAGGLGTRLLEETRTKPKAMVEIGGYPIIWHILKLYSRHGINEAIICGGYRAEAIKDFFHGYMIRNSTVTFDVRTRSVEVHSSRAEPWKVTVVDTGHETKTGGRLRRAREFIGDETFHLTYGDGLSDVDISALTRSHQREQALVTLTAVSPPGRFGAVVLSKNDDSVQSFAEKPPGDGGYINGGFFVVEPRALDYVEADYTAWEEEPMQRLARDGLLRAYRHEGFWQSMDTLRDREYLNGLWTSGKAPWRCWD
jgi:glucose-1-phosphate cytidylyltransferase